MREINFIAIDFETATGKRASICEAGICVVRNGEIVETRSWLVRPQGNSYSYWNMQIHGIRPNDTENSPEFPEVWLYGMEKPDITYYCSLRAARKLYNFGCNSLDYLCDQFKIPCGQHHRAGDDAEMCARLFLRELEYAGCGLEEMKNCNGKL